MVGDKCSACGNDEVFDVTGTDKKCISTQNCNSKGNNYFVSENAVVLGYGDIGQCVTKDQCTNNKGHANEGTQTCEKCIPSPCDKCESGKETCSKCPDTYPYVDY